MGDFLQKPGSAAKLQRKSTHLEPSRSQLAPVAPQRKSKSISVLDKPGVYIGTCAPESEAAMRDLESPRTLQQRRCSNDSVKSIVSGRTTPWAEFTEYVRSIDTDSMSFQQKRFLDRCSSDFQTVMGELKIDEETSVKPINGLQVLAPKPVIEAIPVNEMVNTDNDRTESDVKAQMDRRRMSINIWKAVKNKALADTSKNKKKTIEPKVEEKAEEKPTLTNRDRARQVLYQRYIYEPNSWAEGFSQRNYPKFLLERTEREQSDAKKRKKKSRPLTAAFVRFATPEMQFARNKAKTSVYRSQSSAA